MTEQSREGQVVARLVTYNAKREPMFQDQDGNGWVPIARFNELWDALEWYAERRNYLPAGGEHHYDALVARDAYDSGGPGARARSALGRKPTDG